MLAELQAGDVRVRHLEVLGESALAEVVLNAVAKNGKGYGAGEGGAFPTLSGRGVLPETLFLEIAGVRQFGWHLIRFSAPWTALVWGNPREGTVLVIGVWVV